VSKPKERGEHAGFTPVIPHSTSSHTILTFLLLYNHIPSLLAYCFGLLKWVHCDKQSAARFGLI